jgi:hypothetical protein
MLIYDEIKPIDEQYAVIEKTHGSWDNYLNGYFMRLSPAQRISEIDVFTRSLAEETPRPTKEFAGYCNRRREMIARDELMRNAGR